MIGKAVVIEASDSSYSNDGYPSDDSGLVDIGYVMHENDDIDLNTLLGDDWLGGFSCTKKQGHTACEAQTEDANEPQEPANEAEEPTNGHQQGASEHRKLVEDIEEGDHINAELRAVLDGRKIVSQRGSHNTIQRQRSTIHSLS
ncbi:hypothetical protein Pyn_03864 [Prunus yedoensis var. nudiflora]|uniref:Uncharacterized protein n=1 Tax=Prunus yedoensis var. nudiflora TaxID=2094558 RepID=A0A314XQA4_PRUYE|nr:hypothetical protein Pyn_03864 [Prunus yedoensis var. nudiflora]